jgi:single-strand DNA-binding protein
MANYNKVILVGNLTRDPELRRLPSDTSVVDFGLAVNRKWRSADGQQREDVCFIDCCAFGKQADTIKQYCSKGKQLLVEGRLHLDRWDGKDGQKHSKHKIMVENFQFVGAPAGAGQGAAPGAGGGQYQRPAPAQAPYQAQQPQSQAGADEPAPPSMEEPPPGGDDIPF